MAERKLRLEDKVAIVTGAGSRGPGIGNGKATAILFAREGAKVLLVDRQAERMEETLEMINYEGGEVTTTLPHGLGRPKVIRPATPLPRRIFYNLLCDTRSVVVKLCITVVITHPTNDLKEIENGTKEERFRLSRNEKE